MSAGFCSSRPPPCARGAPPAPRPPPPTPSGGPRRTPPAIGRQLAGTCPFDPDNTAFFKEASHKAGFFPAVLFTVDRMTRSGRVGTAQHHHFSEDGFIHEGVEAYLPRKKKDR